MGATFCRSRKNTSKDMDFENDIYVAGSMKYLEMCGMNIEGKVLEMSKNTRVRRPENI